MPSIVITNIRNVSVDGSPVGALVNAFQEANNAVAVQIALETFCDSKDAELSAKDAQLADQATEADAARQAATEAHAAALAAKDAEKAAAVEAAKLTIQTNLDALVQAAESAHASGDLDAIAAVIAQAKGYTSGARRAKLEANLASAQAAATEAAAKLAALHG